MFIKVIGVVKDDIIINADQIHSIQTQTGGTCVIYLGDDMSHWYTVRTPFEDIWKQLCK